MALNCLNGAHPTWWRFRDRLFVVLTANMAWLCGWATQYISQEYVLTPNFARGLLPMMFGSSSGGGPALRGNPLLPGMIGGSVTAASPNQREAQKLAERQVAAAEVIVYVWRRVMWGVAGFLGLVALLSAISGRSRLLHLLAAGVILSSTAATLVAIRLLIAPDYGGMDPRPVRTYVYVALTQSAYGLVLLAAFVRKPKAVTTNTDPRNGEGEYA